MQALPAGFQRFRNLAKVGDDLLHGFDLVDDGAGRFAEDLFVRLVAEFVSEAALQAFALQADGGERVFDFVGKAFCDFFPGGVSLRVQEFGDVVNDDDVAVTSAFASVGQAAAVAHEDLARAVAVQGDFLLPVFLVGSDDGQERLHEFLVAVFAGLSRFGQRGFVQVDEAEVKYFAGVSVPALQAAATVEGEYATGDVVHDGFQPHFLFDKQALHTVVGLAGVFEALAHVVELAAKVAEFVLWQVGDARVIVTAGDVFGGTAQGAQWVAEAFAEMRRQPDDDEGGEQDGGGEDEDDVGADAWLQGVVALVLAVLLAYIFSLGVEGLGHAVHRLQVEGIFGFSDDGENGDGVLAVVFAVFEVLLFVGGVEHGGGAWCFDDEFARVDTAESDNGALQVEDGEFERASLPP